MPFFPPGRLLPSSPKSYTIRMRFIEIQEKDTPELWKLYLDADPERAVVLQYLPQCRVFALEENGLPLAAACVLPLNRNTCELKNLAVAPSYQRKGLGARLCRGVFEACRQYGFTKITVGTADIAHAPVPFYEKLGFRRTGLLKDFFIIHYAAPIYDGGVQCRDMVLLEKVL